MSEVLKLAEAVTAELAEYNAELLFYPEFELRDLETMKVAVVPVATEYKTLSRASCEELLKVQNFKCYNLVQNWIFFQFAKRSCKYRERIVKNIATLIKNYYICKNM